MDIGKAFSYVFEDPKWVTKVLIGGGILFGGVILSWLLAIPLLIAMFLVLGYELVVIKNVADGSVAPLPEWTDFGALLMKGLYASIGSLIYYLPAILVSCCLQLFPMVLGVGATSTGSSDAAGALAGVVSIATICLSCLSFLFNLLAGITLPAALTRFAMTANQLSIFWDFRTNFEFITKNLKDYIITIIVAWVAGLVGAFGIILCGLGLPFTMFWALLVSAFLYGQLWRTAQSQGTAPATL